MSDVILTVARQVDAERLERAMRAIGKIREECPTVHVEMIEGYPTVDLGDVSRAWLTPAREKFLDGHAAWLISVLDGRPTYFMETLEQWMRASRRSTGPVDISWRYSDALAEVIERAKLTDEPKWFGALMGGWMAKGWSVEVTSG